MAEWPCCYDPLRVSLCPRIFFLFYFSSPSADSSGVFYSEVDMLSHIVPGYLYVHPEYFTGTEGCICPDSSGVDMNDNFFSTRFQLFPNCPQALS